MQTTTKLTLSSNIQRSEQQVDCCIDQEVVLLSIVNGEYYNLDPVASEIWGLLEQPRSIAQIVEQQLQDYKVERADCEKDVLQFLERLMTEGLVNFANVANQKNIPRNLSNTDSFVNHQ